MSAGGTAPGRFGFGGDLRLLRIEVRRNGGWSVLVPLLLVAMALATKQLVDAVVVLWGGSSAMVRDCGAYAVPLVGGLAAFLADRARRRRTEELLGPTSVPVFVRRMHEWTGLVLWALAAYLFFGLYVLAVTLGRATWGGPVAGPLSVGLLSIVAAAALGYAVGVWVPGRFTAPLLAVALFAAELFVSSRTVTGLKYLSPSTDMHQDVWYGMQPDPSALQSLFLCSTGAASLAAIALKGRRTPAPWLTLILAVAGSAVAVHHAATAPALQDTQGEDYQRSTTILSYEPVCSQDHLRVCVHPAYQAMLTETSRWFNALLEPIAGLPGAPKGAEQLPDPSMPASSPRLIAIGLYGSGDETASQAYNVASSGVSASGESRLGQSGKDAQEAIAYWLMLRAGEDVSGHESDPDWPRIWEAAERFGRLQPTQQRTWLEANYADLRTGKLGLEDLP